MNANESSAKQVQQVTADVRFTEEIQLALENMRRVKTAQGARAEEVQETPGNKYELPPWPFVFRVSNSGHRE